MEHVRKLVRRSSLSRVSKPLGTSAVDDVDCQHLVVPSAPPRRKSRKFSLKRKSVRGIKKSVSKSSVSATIFDAVRRGSIEETTAFLESTKGFMNRKSRKVVDELGWGLLHVAVESHKLEIVQLLVRAGFDPNELAKDTNVTPLAIAVCSGDVEITSYLVSIQSVREAYRDYQVTFIMSSAADDSVSADALNVRLSAQRKLRRYGQPFCKPMPLWQAAVLAGGVLQAQGGERPFRAAYLLQRTKQPGLAIQPSLLANGDLPLQHMHGEYLRLLFAYPEDVTGLASDDLSSAMKDLLWWQIHQFTSDLRPSTTLAHVKSTLGAVFALRSRSSTSPVASSAAASPTQPHRTTTVARCVSLDVVNLVQQVVHPACEQEVITKARVDEREAYVKRMSAFKILMLRAVKRESGEQLYDINVDSPLGEVSGVKLSVSAKALEMPTTAARTLASAAAPCPGPAGGGGSGSGGLCHSLARFAPVQQISSVAFWRELLAIFGRPARECLATELGGSDIVVEVQKRKGAFKRAQGRGVHSLEECDRVVAGLVEVEAYLHAQMQEAAEGGGDAPGSPSQLLKPG